MRERKTKKEDIIDFVNYGKELPKKNIVILFVIDFMIYALAVMKGFNAILSATVLSPFVIASLIVVIIYSINKSLQRRQRFLLIGIKSIISSLFYQCASVLFKPRDLTACLIMLSVVLCANLTVALLTIPLSKLRIYKNKSGVSGWMTSGIIAVFVLLCGIVTRHTTFITPELVCIFCSLVFSMMCINLVKYRYMVIFDID